MRICILSKGFVIGKCFQFATFGAGGCSNLLFNFDISIYFVYICNVIATHRALIVVFACAMGGV